MKPYEVFIMLNECYYGNTSAISHQQHINLFMNYVSLEFESIGRIINPVILKVQWLIIGNFGVCLSLTTGA